MDQVDVDAKADRWHIVSMGYCVKTLKNNPRRDWKLQYRTYKGGRQVDRDIPEDEWQRLGFRRDMSRDEAKARQDQLNALEQIKRVEERRIAIKARLNTEATVLQAFLNPIDLKEFEERVLYEGFYSGDREAVQRNKVESHWRTAQRVLCELQIEPKEWGERRKTFYAYFTKKRFSPSYLQKVIRVLNLWGRFVARKSGSFHDPLPYPRGYEKEKVADAYFNKNPDGMESAPLTAQLLDSKQSAMQPEHFAWVYLSLWFGLRPVEVDGLKDPKLYRIEYQKGTPVLWVYQSKLKSIARDKRWKYIPCVRPEQRVGIDVLKAQRFERPLSKTVQNHFGPDYTLYAGRKGFEGLMESFGYTLEQYSLWLGHQTIERTWRNYKAKQRVVIPIT